MMLTDLADVARAAGLNVVETTAWQRRGHGQLRSVETIVCHHTATPASAAGDYPSLRVVRDGRTDLRGPLAQLGLGRDGTVYVIAAGIAYHAGVVRDPSYGNPVAIGIEAEHPGTGAWPAVQYDAYVRLCAALVQRYGLAVNRVLGHKEVCAPAGRKVDPNLDMARFRADVARQLAPPKTPKPPTQLTKVRDKLKRLRKKARAKGKTKRAARIKDAITRLPKR